ncbi:putative extracellular exo-polygalacturonase [Aspergillus flavus AF70]|nr:putative extracellular exo-polygalacturonase [Aspergillus flavus AF70]
MRWLSTPLVAVSLSLGLSAISHASQIDRKGNICTVKANSNQTDDIASRLNPILGDVTIEWRGKWTFSDDLDYWRNHSYPVAFQNHAAGFVITGCNITIDGYGTGGIDGNGNVWYTAENVSDVHVDNFYVKDPQLWTLNIMNGTNMQFNNITCNATAVDAPYGEN